MNRPVLLGAAGLIAALAFTPAHADRLVFVDGQLVPEAEAPLQSDAIATLPLDGIKAWVSMAVQNPEAMLASIGLGTGTPANAYASAFLRDAASNIALVTDYARKYLNAGRPLTPSSLDTIAVEFMAEATQVGTRNMDTADAERVLAIWQKAASTMPANLCGNGEGFLAFVSNDDLATVYRARTVGVRKHASGSRIQLPTPEEAWNNVHARVIKTLGPSERQAVQAMGETAQDAWVNRCWYAQRLIEAMPGMTADVKGEAVRDLVALLLQ